MTGSYYAWSSLVHFGVALLKSLLCAETDFSPYVFLPRELVPPLKAIQIFVATFHVRTLQTSLFSRLTGSCCFDHFFDVLVLNSLLLQLFSICYLPMCWFLKKNIWSSNMAKIYFLDVTWFFFTPCISPYPFPSWSN